MATSLPQKKQGNAKKFPQTNLGSTLSNSVLNKHRVWEILKGHQVVWLSDVGGMEHRLTASGPSDSRQVALTFLISLGFHV